MNDQVATNEHVTDVNDVTPATAQQVSAFVQITSLGESASRLELEDGYTMSQMRGSFEALIHKAIKDRKTNLLKPLTDAKNIIQRHDIELQISTHGSFNIGDVPYKEACPTCGGAGETYRFFRDTVVEDCKFCNGSKKVEIPCPDCNGAGKFTKHADEVSKKSETVINPTCTRCVDKHGKPTGKIQVKCWRCKATGKHRRYPIAAKIKSTTHCQDCKGRGFTLPDPPKRNPRIPDNPVIEPDIAAQIKSAKVEE